MEIKGKEMLIYLIIFLFFICNGMKIAEENSFHKDYMDYRSTTAINGIFVVLIFFSHCTQNLTLDGPYDGIYVTMKESLLQMVVVPFLFYSGYGIMESIKTKKGYVKGIIRNRFLKVLVHFDIAVLVYLCLQMLLGRRYEIWHVVQSLIGWTSVGNSNWYIFVTLVLYIMVFAAFIIPLGKDGPVRHLLGIAGIIILAAVYLYFMKSWGVPTRFYNTILLFPSGMLYSMERDKIEKICMKNDICYMASGIIVFVIYYYAYCHARESIFWYSVWGCAFMAMILLFNMKISLKNNMLIWFGKNVFGIYIWQRVPMIILKNLRGGIYTERTYVFIFSCFIATIFITMIFNYILKKVDSRLFKKG